MKQRLLFILSAVILTLSVTARDFTYTNGGKSLKYAAIANAYDDIGTEEFGTPVPFKTGNDMQPCKVKTKELTGEGTGIYLRGNMSDWAPLPEWEFRTTDVTGRYIIEDCQMEAGNEFKVADATWSEYMFGSSGDLYLDTPYKLNSGTNEGNIVLEVDFTGDVILEIDNDDYYLLLQTKTPEPYSEWVDWQTTDVSVIRNFFVQYGFNDTQTAVDKGIVNVQRRVNISDPTISQLKLENVLGDVDLIAYVNTAEGSFVFPDQDTGIPNTHGGSYETLHFFTQYYTGYKIYEDGLMGLQLWALISPNMGYTIYNDVAWLIFPGEWGEPMELGRYIPDTEMYDDLKTFISKLGNEGVAWEEAIDVDYCVNLMFPNRQRHTFHKLIGGKDAYTDRLVSVERTQTIKTVQTTDFILGGEYYDGTKKLTFYFGELGDYGATHSLSFDLYFIIDASNNSAYVKSVVLTKEGHEPLSSKIEGDNFISSTQKTATFSIPHSGEVDEWRMYVMKNTYQFSNAMQGNESNISYVVVDSENITIPCDTLGVFNSLRLVPMSKIDGKMKQSGPYSSIGVFRNVPLDGEWEEWGEGKMTDVVAFPYLGYWAGDKPQSDQMILMPPAERRVRIERRKDAPGIIRIPDPYKGDYPYRDKMKMVDTDDTFYLVIDTTDPSRVTAERTLTGTSDYSIFGFYVNEPENTKYGKCLDKKVIFRNNLSWNSYHANLRQDSIPQLSLELPGYKDFTVAIDKQLSDGEKVTIENMSENVVSVDMALVPADEYNSYYPERMCELVMNGSDGLFVHNYPVKAGATLSVEIAELAKSNSRSVDALPSGRYRVVAVPRDADGNQHYGPVSEEVTYTAPWKYLGIAEINDWAIMVVFNYPEGGFNITAEAYEDPFNPGVYMLKDCYKDYAEQFKASIPMAEFGEYEPTSMYIDARDPDKVNLVANEVLDPFATNRGFNTGVFLNLGPDYEGYNGYQYLNTYGNAMGSEDEIRYGKKEGDYITFDRNSLVTSWTGGSQFYYIKNSLNIKLPGNGDSGVGNIADDDNSMYPVEWYNLQGMRINIDNAPAGIYIRRQGIKSEKVYFRK